MHDGVHAAGLLFYSLSLLPFLFSSLPTPSIGVYEKGAKLDKYDLCMSAGRALVNLLHPRPIIFPLEIKILCNLSPSLLSPSPASNRPRAALDAVLLQVIEVLVVEGVLGSDAVLGAVEEEALEQVEAVGVKIVKDVPGVVGPEPAGEALVPVL